MPKLPPVWKRPAYLPPNTSLGSPRVIDVMMRFVKNRGTVIQAGAHVGLWPAVLSQHFERVVSFEPHKQLAAVAREAAPYPNVTIHEAALTDCARQLFLSVPGGEKAARFSGSSTIVPDLVDGVEIVGGAAIDSLPYSDIGAIVLDIEGHELQALRGATRTLRESLPVVVVEENAKSLRHRAPGEMARFLGNYGYKRVASYESDIIFAVRR